MYLLTAENKEFYQGHYGIDIAVMSYPEGDEFLYWVNRGIDPRDNPLHEWSHASMVDVALSIYFSDRKPLLESIDYLYENLFTY